MNHGLLKKLLPHFIAILLFLIVAVVYCRPVLQGKVLQQHDVTQWKAMAQNSFVYKETHGRFPLWTNSMFSGMPAYQIAMDQKTILSPGIFYYVLTLGLPKPISFFFLACVCFYFLSQVLRVNPYIGIIGSLAYAYATYNPIIIAAGHDTKMQSIAFIPALIGSLILVYEKRYWLGGALTALATALLIGMNHPQIAYYSFLIAFFMTVAYAIQWIRQRDFRHVALSAAIVAVAALTGILTNAVTLFTTFEYAKASIRGGSELAQAGSNATKTGLSKDYALSYSMYKSEPLVMMVPKMFGGSNGLEVPEEESKAIEALQQMPQELGQQLQYNLGSYWGGIGQTSGPPYVGAIICFLTLIGFLVLDTKHKWWILALSVLATLMSWGSYFEGFNTFLLNTLPMYNKFRAPSMTIVIPTFLFCMMAVMTLQKIISNDETKEELWQRYKKGLYLTGGVFAVLLLIYFSADYRSAGDQALLNRVTTAAVPPQVKEYVTTFLSALKDDRQSLFLSSLIRSFFFAAAAAFMIWLRIRKSTSAPVVLGVIGLLSFADVMAIDTRYLNADNYQDEAEYQIAFAPSPQDQQILQDTSYYRVFDIRQGLSVALGMQGAAPSYFHKSIGGYHPAKLSIYQDLIEHQLSKFPASMPVVNMLNTKYIIQGDASGTPTVYTNPDALGAAWFVKAIRFESTPAAVMNALSDFSPRDTAILFSSDQNNVSAQPATDSTASIRLIKNDNDVITYQAAAAANGFAVFSEIFYDKGWTAYIDGKEAPILRANYVLRGLNVPAGNHEIRFEFKPRSYYTGQPISNVAGILVFVLLLLAAWQFYKGRRNVQLK
jgi:hypothetical protein